MNTCVFDANERDFERDVVERSKSVPVVVDFWAPWCGPCRTLGPLLDRLAEEFQGEFLVAKVNVDENPQLAAAFSARSIPMVLGLRHGKVVAEFVGALPESQIRQFLQRLLPSEAEQITTAARNLIDAGDRVTAEQEIRRALDLDPRCGAALLTLAEIQRDQQLIDEALATLERISPADSISSAAERLAADLRLSRGANFDVNQLEERIRNNAGDLDARFELAQAHASARRFEQALEHYLEVVKRDRAYREDGARKAMLDVFEILGRDDELVDRFRGELAKVLYS